MLKGNVKEVGRKLNFNFGNDVQEVNDSISEEEISEEDSDEHEENDEEERSDPADDEGDENDNGEENEVVEEQPDKNTDEPTTSASVLLLKTPQPTRIVLLKTPEKVFYLKNYLC
jgi:hypothetical protein